MYQVLSELNKTPGVTGSMVVGMDGIVIAADLESGSEGDTVGALAASITSNVQKSLDRLDSSPPSQITIEAENAKLFLSDAGIGLLVVTAQTDVNIGLIRLEIKHALKKLKPGE
jgi:predicted regulator of Ras-like GTPase activity (Roadblock/LC7/MglB family)